MSKKNKITIAAIIVFLWVSFGTAEEKTPGVDSNMSLEEAIAGSKAPKKILDELTIIDVEYFGFDGKLHVGQLVLRKDRVDDIRRAFKIMREEKFPIKKCVPIVKYNWDDNASMADNNTSMFNFRTIAGTNRLSNHAYGVAIDINPFQNPAVYKSGKVSPKGASYDINAPGTLLPDSKVTKYLISRGWRWGGDWHSLKDWQHFDKK